MQEKLNNRGGSKKETVYDLIKREKKKLRQKIIMNQKANSIADLAAVLIAQEEKGTKLAESREKHLKRKINDDVRAIVQLAEDFENGGLQKIDDEVEMINTMLKEGVDGYKNQLRVRRDQYLQNRQKMEFATTAVREAKALAELSPKERQRQANYWKALVESQELAVAEGEKRYAKPKSGRDIDIRSKHVWTEEAFASTMHHEYKQTWEQIAVACRAEGYEMPALEPEPEPEPELEASSEHEVEATPESKPSAPKPETADKEPEEKKLIDYKTILPCFPARLDPKQIEPKYLRKRGGRRYELGPNHRPIFTSEGVKVQWANFLDAEFAEAWPEAVQHERMDGKRERLELLQQKRDAKQEQHDMDLAEMVKFKRKEMGLAEEIVQEQVEEDEPDVLEEVAEDIAKEKTVEEGAQDVSEKTAAEGPEEEPIQVKSVEEEAAEYAAELAAKEELDAKEAAAREAAVQELKAVRQGRRLPPQLEGIQSEILARVQAKARKEGWKNASRLQQVSQPPVENTPPPPAS